MNYTSKAFWVITIIAMLASIYGWIANIAKLIGTDVFNGMAIARAIGILVAPLGAVLGFF